MHLQSLINKLSSKDDFIFVHVDKNVDIKVFDSLANCNDNLFFIKKRYSISWGGFSMIEAMLALIYEATNLNKMFSHLIFLSGNDYPIKEKKQIDVFFRENEGIEIVKAYKITNNGCSHCNCKITRYWYFDSNVKNNFLRKFSIKIRNMLGSLKRKENKVLLNNRKVPVYFGSQWFAITERCALYILDTVRKNPKFVDYFKTSMAPDEMFFHTIIFNSKFNNFTTLGEPEEYNPNWNLSNYTYLDSTKLNCYFKKEVKRKKFSTYVYQILRSEKVGSIPYLTSLDYEKICESQFLFARKFNFLVSKKLIKKINNFETQDGQTYEIDNE